jgi:ADP-Ribosyltransferase in polyvalent proteins
MYHGSPCADIRRFKPSDITGLIWTTQSKAVARGWADTYAACAGRVYPLYVKAKKIFDPTIAHKAAYDLAYFFALENEHLFYDGYWPERLECKAHDNINDVFARKVSHSEWVSLELQEFLEWLHDEKGFDGIVSDESNAYNLAVFSPNQIKHAVEA